MSSSQDLSNLIGNMFKEELTKNIEIQRAKRETKSRDELREEAQATVARAQREMELARRFYVTMALKVMMDVNSAEAMNYDWKDLATLAEKIRAYCEAGAYIDDHTAWKNIPKMTADEDPMATLGD